MANYLILEENKLSLEEKLTVVVIKEEKHHGCSRRLCLETVALEKGRVMPLGSYSAEKIFCNVSVSMMTLNY